jgi:hypothetical protein
MALAHGRSHSMVRAMTGKEVVRDEGSLEDRMMIPDGDLIAARTLIGSPPSAHMNDRKPGPLYPSRTSAPVPELCHTAHPSQREATWKAAYSCHWGPQEEEKRDGKGADLCLLV